MFNYNVVDEIITKIVDEFNPLMVVIFGSVASGNARNDSDVDIFVVMNTDLPYYQRSAIVRRKLADIQVGMDVIVVTPQEFENHRNDDSSFITEIMATGKIAYEA